MADRGQGHCRGRLATGGGAALLALLAAGGAVLAGPAAARADEHDYLTVTGVTLTEPLAVEAAVQPETYAALRQEVSWLRDRPGDAPEPDADALRLQFTIVLAQEGEEQHRFHLYPLAEGGPRVFRPAEQPGDRTVEEAWFFGRLSLPDTLEGAGVPLSGKPVAPAAPVPEEPEATATPDGRVLGYLGLWRVGVLLTAGVVVVLVLAVGGVAYLIRRKV